MKKLRIGMILDKNYPPDPRVESEALLLIEAGFEVYLFAIDFYEGRLLEEDYKNIHITRMRMRKTIFRKFSPLAYTIPVYHLFLKSKINLFIKKNKIEVIHCHDMVVAGLVLKLNIKLNLPMILDLHENRPEIMTMYSHITTGIGQYLVNINKWVKLQQMFIEKANVTIVVTQEAKEDILENCKVDEKKIIVVPNTVLLDEFLSYKIDKSIIDKFVDSFVLLYIGATGLRRGTDTAIQSLKYLVNKIDNIKLVLVGKSRDDSQLKRIARQSGVEKHVSFEGFQSHSLLPSYIYASNICLSPLKRNRHHDTTLANKIFQYMSLGKPVVVSDSTSQAKIVSEINSGLVHIADNPKDLADKILFLYQDLETAKTMSENGQRAVHHKYNWKVTGKELVNLYKNLN